jgi:alpha-L-fucosidase 2
MKDKKLFTLLLGLIVTATVCAQNYKLWYNSPAEVWTEALPLGNGRLGAMVFGIPTTERIQLNEETIWAGSPNNNANPEAKQYMKQIQQLVFQGKYKEAEDMASEKIMSQTNSGMPYQTFGDVYISTPNATGYTDYSRELSLDSAIATTTYRVGDVTFRRTAITSFADNVIEIHFTASRKGMISFNANFTSPHNDVLIKSEDGEVSLSGVAMSHEGNKGRVRFEGRMAVKTIGGQQCANDGVISVSGADEAILYLNIATNFVNYKDISGDEDARVKTVFHAAMNRDYAQQLAAHIATFHKYMGRTSLYLGPDRFSNLTTEQRVERFADNNDNWLAATYFTFGRYLLICSSQPGTQPATLQGIWNDKLFPAWDSKYTTNINLEMNYWPSEVTNLTEMNEPLWQLINEVSQSGHQSAQTMYGVDGWVLHHNTDIWRITGGVDHASSGMWMTGGAWLCQHLWQHYLYTGDKEFLRRAFPVMKGAATFLNDMLIRDPQTGWFVINPTVSPENVHPAEGGKQAISAGTTLDNELIFDLFNELKEASQILGEDQDSASLMVKRLQEMPPMQIGRWGQLQEWMQDWDDPDDNNRHVSHLYSLYPGNMISPYRTPELFDAARTSLIHRGDASTGWSMGWKVCLWARLLDGNHAYKLIKDQLRLTDDKFISYGTKKKSGGTYGNLFDAHPPFQIDGNFGCTAGIAEMLMQSHDGCVYLLPAIPTEWNSGTVKGIVSRGGFEIEEMTWQDGRITKLRIKSRLGGNLRLRVGAPIAGLKRAKNGINPNPLFALPEAKTMKNNSKTKLNKVVLPKTYLYDISTTAGQELTII